MTERLQELRTEEVALRHDLQRLAELVYRMAGRLDGMDRRFDDIDKQVQMAVRIAVRDELDTQRRQNGLS